MVNQLVQRLTNLDFKQLINLNKKLKIYIYPNLQGLLLGLFVFFCFLISVFYENNSGLLISIVIFFIFFISIFISHQNINNLRINFLTEYLVEANKTEHINFKIINDAKESDINGFKKILYSMIDEKSKKTTNNKAEDKKIATS